MSHTLTRISLGVLTLVVAAVGTVSTAQNASATPDTPCMRAGLGTLREAGLLPSVAKQGLPIIVAVSVGVTPRPGTDVTSLPDPLPLSLVLADHRAGDDSLFVYPWC